MVEKKKGWQRKTTFLREGVSSLPNILRQEAVSVAKYGLRRVAAVAWEIRVSFELEFRLHVEKVNGNVVGDVLRL